MVIFLLCQQWRVAWNCLPGKGIHFLLNEIHPVFFAGEYMKEYSFADEQRSIYYVPYGYSNWKDISINIFIHLGEICNIYIRMKVTDQQYNRLL